MKKIKTKVIECNVLLLTEPKNRIMKFVFASNSIDSVVLDLQELYPDVAITRNSILNWKFLTVGEYKKLEESMKGRELFNNVLNDAVSDTTDDDSNSIDGKQK